MQSRILDVPRVSDWVRRHEKVIVVPGAGLLEAGLPVRPWNIGYSDTHHAAMAKADLGVFSNSLEAFDLGLLTQAP